jgi:transglutaminase-like putative cysteine protease
VYAYEHPAPYAIQLLRLTPRPHDGLCVEGWRVGGDPGRTGAPQRDGFGNTTHLHVVREPHIRLRLVADGLVETRDTAGIVRGADEPLPPPFYLRSTSLTLPDAALHALATEARGGDPHARLHHLLTLVHERLAYRPGVTGVPSTAAVALASGVGGCQDHAHVFVTAARLLGVPARYVGGYHSANGSRQPGGVGHAWAEAHHPDLGWIGFDPTRGTCADQRHVPCSVGLDSGDAASVRGLPAPGGADLTVRLIVAEVQQQ